MKHTGFTPGPWRSLSSGQFKGADGKSLMRVLDHNAKPLPRALIRWNDEPTMRLALDAPRLAEENENLRALLARVLDAPVMSRPGTFAEVRELEADIRAALTAGAK